MSRKNKCKLFIEAPCFGFGPISTSISVARRLEEKYEIVFITFGEALQFLQKSTRYNYLEIDTRYEENFAKVIPYINLEDLFIVNTNVEFSTFLLSEGYDVLVIDTLYWMWNSVPEVYSLHENFIMQTYYGKNIGELPQKIECRPIIDYSIWKKEKIYDSREALISFGGMAEPGNHKIFLEYAYWMIKKIADSLPDEIEVVNIVGGLFKEGEPYSYSKKVKIHGNLSTLQYNKLIKQSKYIFLSPGLTSIYEMLASGRVFCLLPGLNVSQVYQGYHFNRMCNYPYCILWPDVDELVKVFKELAELEGLDYLENYLTNCLCKNRIDFNKIIKAYLYAVDNLGYDNEDKILNAIFNHSSVDSLTESILDRMVRSKVGSKK